MVNKSTKQPIWLTSFKVNFPWFKDWDTVGLDMNTLEESFKQELDRQAGEVDKVAKDLLTIQNPKNDVVIEAHNGAVLKLLNKKYFRPSQT